MLVNECLVLLLAVDGLLIIDNKSFLVVVIYLSIFFIYRFRCFIRVAGVLWLALAECFSIYSYEKYYVAI